MSDIVKYIDMRIYECAEQGHDHMALTLKAVQALRAELAESRRLLDEVRSTLIGIAGATARAWELPRNEFIDEFLPWAQSRARDAVEKMKAAPVPAQPDDVAKDAARYRWMRADGPNTYMTLKENAHLIGDAYDAAIDAAILSATDSEVKK